MSKRKVGEIEEVSKGFPITIKEITKYRAGLKELEQKNIGDDLVPRFDQLMQEWGFARIEDNGQTVVLNPLEFHYWIRVRDSVEDYDHAQYRGAMEEVSGEAEAHAKKVKGWSAQLHKLFTRKVWLK